MPKSTKFNGQQGLSTRLSTAKSGAEALNATNNISTDPVNRNSSASNDGDPFTSNPIKRKHIEGLKIHRVREAFRNKKFVQITYEVWQRGD